jgi:hypothetical protein
MCDDTVFEGKDTTKISNSEVTLQIRGSDRDGIYIEVYSKLHYENSEEVILKEEIQTNFSDKEYQSVSITWSS